MVVMVFVFELVAINMLLSLLLLIVKEVALTIRMVLKLGLLSHQASERCCR